MVPAATVPDVQDPVFVDIAEFCSAFQHGIGREIRLGRPAKFFVELAKQLVLAGSGDDEITGRENQVLRGACRLRIEKEHRGPPAFLAVNTLASQAISGP